MVVTVVESLGIDAVDRVTLWLVERDDRDQVEGFVSIANWQRGDSPLSLAVGVRSPMALLPTADLAWSNDALFFEDVLADERVDETARSVFATQAVRSLALLPIQSDQRQPGLLMVVTGQTPHAFAPGEMRLLALLSEQMAAALERARLLEQTQARARRESVIRDVSDRMQRAVDIESLMRITAEDLARALGASGAYVQMGTENELAGE
jgi:GAF domain-containing protein